MHLFQEYELTQDFDLDIVKLMKFLSESYGSVTMPIHLHYCMNNTGIHQLFVVVLCISVISVA